MWWEKLNNSGWLILLYATRKENKLHYTIVVQKQVFLWNTNWRRFLFSSLFIRLIKSNHHSFSNSRCSKYSIDQKFKRLSMCFYISENIIFISTDQMHHAFNMKIKLFLVVVVKSVEICKKLLVENVVLIPFLLALRWVAIDIHYLHFIQTTV